MIPDTIRGKQGGVAPPVSNISLYSHPPTLKGFTSKTLLRRRGYFRHRTKLIMGCYGVFKRGEAPSFSKTFPLSKSGEGDTGGEVDK